MANTLTGLIPDLYAALDKVSREMVGFIPSVGTSLSGTPAAVNEKIVIPIAPRSESMDISPSMTIQEPADQIIGNVEVAITKQKSVPFGFIAEEQRGLDNGPGHLNLQAKMIAQAMRTLVNEVEQDVAMEAALHASRAWGAPGDIPFADSLKDTAQLKKILKDNGAPLGDLQLVLNTTAGANVLGLTQLTNVNQAGDEGLLRQGLLTSKPIHGFHVRETGASVMVDTGTGSGYTTDTSGYAIGTTEIALTTGTGTIENGAFITFAGDSNKYMVAVGISSPGTIKIASPGLRQAVPASAVAVTLGADFEANIAFDRDAIQLVTRAPAMPKEGDARMDSMVIQDPISGLAFEVSVWGGNRKVRYEVSLAWGQKAIKDSNIVMLLS